MINVPVDINLIGTVAIYLVILVATYLEGVKMFKNTKPPVRYGAALGLSIVWPLAYVVLSVVLLMSVLFEASSGLGKAVVSAYRWLIKIK